MKSKKTGLLFLQAEGRATGINQYPRATLGVYQTGDEGHLLQANRSIRRFQQLGTGLATPHPEGPHEQRFCLSAHLRSVC